MAAINTLRYCLTITILLSGSFLFAQSPFEGKIVLRISGDETSDIEYFVKDGKVRMEVDAEGNEAVLLFNTQTSKTIMMMPAQNMYMEIDASQYNMPELNSNNNKKDETDNINRTGEYKDINGYKSEKWIIKDEDGGIVEAWMTDELGSFFMMMNPMDPGAQAEWQQKLQGNFFPMKVVEIEDGEEKSSMEVLSAEEMTLKDELFQVNPGMQKFNMPNMDMYKQK